MKKLANKLGKGRKDATKVEPPNPLPAPAPHPARGRNNRGLRPNSKAQPDDDVGTFDGFGSWMASFEPDPNARGVVELAAQQAQTAIGEVLSLEEGKFLSSHFWNCCHTHQSTYFPSRVASRVHHQTNLGRSEETG